MKVVDENTIAVSPWEEDIWFFDINSLERTKTFKLVNPFPKSFSISKSNGLLASREKENDKFLVKLFDLESTKMLRRIDACPRGSVEDVLLQRNQPTLTVLCDENLDLDGNYIEVNTKNWDLEGNFLGQYSITGDYFYLLGKSLFEHPTKPFIGVLVHRLWQFPVTLLDSQNLSVKQQIGKGSEKFPRLNIKSVRISQKGDLALHTDDRSPWRAGAAGRVFICRDEI